MGRAFYLYTQYVFYCEKCEKEFVADDHDDMSVVKCPHCGRELKVEEE